MKENIMSENWDILNIGYGDPIIFRNWWLDKNILPNINTQHTTLYEYQEENISSLINATHKFHQLFGTDAPLASIIYGNKCHS